MFKVGAFLIGLNTHALYIQMHSTIHTLGMKVVDLIGGYFVMWTVISFKCQWKR